MHRGLVSEPRQDEMLVRREVQLGPMIDRDDQWTEGLLKAGEEEVQGGAEAARNLHASQLLLIPRRVRSVPDLNLMNVIAPWTLP